ncbi:MAG: geranylgeranyl reductase family protein [Nitrospirae bacterium]|nr:geranylgeranyl reductase family protein [Nitrospirota bacterium]
MKQKTDVVVVGGGPAGSISAKLLAESGIDTILLERDTSFGKPCGGGIPYGAFKEFNIPESLIEKESKSVRIVSPSGKNLDIELGKKGIAIVERRKFDVFLRNEVVRRGVKVVEGNFINLNTEKNGYCVKANVRGEVTEIYCKYIIATDGVNSRVRSILNIKPNKYFITVSEKIKGIETDFCEFWFSSSHAKGSYSWVFPSKEGISIGTGSIQPGTAINLLKLFKSRRGIKENGHKRIYKIPLWKGDLYNKDNVIFAGDSAGQVMPLTYEGIYYAMKSGEFAARAIIEGKASIYKKMWQSTFQKRFYFMDKLRRYFYKNDNTIEKLIAFHRNPEVQEASIRLWLMKDSGKESLNKYIKIFRKLICLP